MSFTAAKSITSPQIDIHKNLKSVVEKHLHSTFQKPIAEYSQTAFHTFYQRWVQLGRPKIVLDSACGTGESTRYFSKQYPEYLVVGLDQSAKRLSNSDNNNLGDNHLLLRCDCTDFWRLTEQAEINIEKHFLLYPNPWPKPQHLQRRWQGHPSLPSLLAISDSIVLRTNWKVYAQEFNAALNLANRESLLATYDSSVQITAFERKYTMSHHQLWQVQTK